MTPRSRRAEWTGNAAASAVLLLLIVVAGNRLAKEHLRGRWDLSEERLFTTSPVAERMLGELGDILQVKAYFTGELKHGPVQIAKGRLIDQLGEFEDAARGRMQVLYADPNASTEVRAEAVRYGIEPVPLRAIQGTSELTQEVFFGLVLRYRGREAALPFVLPQTLQYGFLSELNRLMREEEVAIGFVGAGATGDGALPDAFGEARGLLGGRYSVRELNDLADGNPVPDDVAVLVVPRPVDLHPRAVFAIDGFVQRGGHVLFLIEHTLIDLERLRAVLVDTGLAEMLELWGAPVGEELVWDQECNYLTIQGTGRTQYPFWLNVGDGGMERSVPAIGRLPGADLFWAHPVGLAPLPEGVERVALVRSSSNSWTVAPEDALIVDTGPLNARGIELYATEPGAPRDLVVALSGRFPSPFEELGAPAPRDAIEEALHAEEVRQALSEGREPPEREWRTTDEAVPSAAAEAQVVVGGDADWVSDGRFFSQRNRVLFENLVDWLALEKDLVALRAELPRERRIVDFLEEELAVRGLSSLRATLGVGSDADDPELVAAAERAAARRRHLHVAGATGGSFLLALLLAALRRLALRPGVAA